MQTALNKINSSTDSGTEVFLDSTVLEYSISLQGSFYVNVLFSEKRTLFATLLFASVLAQF